MSRSPTLREHQSRAARIKAKKVRAGEIQSGAGRPQVESFCPKCGSKCESFRLALAHCRAKKKKSKQGDSSNA